MASASTCISSDGTSQSTVVELQRDVPVVYDLGVAVAGGGISGVCAAIASARHGADTLIIDRFGQIGGNIGPGMIAGGGIHGPQGKPLLENLTGLCREFCAKIMELGGVCHGWYGDIDFTRESNIMSYVALTMLQEAGVKLMLSTYVGDPIIKDDRIRGVFVENKSGRQAVKANVVVDATGEADLARKTGAPIIQPKYSYGTMDPHAPTGMGSWFVMGGVDWDEYQGYAGKQAHAGEEDIHWADGVMGSRYRALITRDGSHLLPLVRKAWESGDFRAVQEIEGLGHIALGLTTHLGADRVASLLRLGIELSPDGESGFWSEKMDAGDGMHISACEVALRKFAFEDVEFRKNYVPGFRNAYLMFVAPFLGVRGGPCIEGEHVRNSQDAGEALKDDVSPGISYGVMLPQGLDGLLAVGRSASSIPDTGLRGRTTAMLTGEIGGIAAALASREGVTPKTLDVRRLQQAIVDSGLYLGDDERLAELGLTPPAISGRRAT